jgi:hypothetical protein
MLVKVVARLLASYKDRRMVNVLLEWNIGDFLDVTGLSFAIAKLLTTGDL